MKQYRRRLRLHSVENGIFTFLIYSRSRDNGLSYTVTADTSRVPLLENRPISTACTCSAYKFRGDCWHAQRALEYTQNKLTTKQTEKEN